jgi:hypothetical protein
LRGVVAIACATETSFLWNICRGMDIDLRKYPRKNPPEIALKLSKRGISCLGLYLK